MEPNANPTPAPERSLRTLFESRGYSVYRMGRFEEYDLYAKNRSFITGSAILTFTDTTGRLMALKPDVTLSLIKNLDGGEGLCKVYYHERVYRAPDPLSGFREIPQMGLECLGPLDPYTVCEVTELAARSLLALGGRTVLDVSHMGLLSGFLEDIAAPEDSREELLRLCEAKNLHDLRRRMTALGLDRKVSATLEALVSLRGGLETAVRDLSALELGPRASDAVTELAALARTLRLAGETLPVMLEPSLRGDPRYYNGVVLKGYLEGVPTPILSGGRYDGLLRRLGKSSGNKGRKTPIGAMGFAVYLDLLERLRPPHEPFVDVLLLTDGSASADEVYYWVRTLQARGLSVRVDVRAPEGLRFGQVLHVGEEEDV